MRQFSILNCQLVPNIAFCCMKTGGYGIGFWVAGCELRVSGWVALIFNHKLEGWRQINACADFANYGANYWKG